MSGGRALWLLVLLAAACQRREVGAAIAVVGEATRLRWDDALPRATPWFDGERVTLRAARGETIGIQVVREGRGEVEVVLEIAGAPVSAFEVDFHDVTRPSTAMYGGSRGVGRYPDRLRPVDGRRIVAAREAYFEIVADGSAAGMLTVGTQQFPVELVVEDVALPATPLRVWAYYDPREVGGADAAFAAMFRAYGVLASPELTADTWAARRAQVAGAPFIPVLLPLEPEAVTADVRGWIERTRDTGQVPFAIPIDEPRRIVDQLRVRARAAIVRAAGGGPGRFLYAVTQRRGWLLGPDVDVHITPFGGDWTYNGTPPWAGAMVIDADEPGTRTWGWIGFRHDVPLWYVWDAAYWRDRYNRGRDRAPRHDLLADPITFDDGEDRGNLDGVLAYVDDAGRALPSLRLAALRRGLQDRALLDALSACAGRPAADAIAAALVPHSLGTARRGDRISWPHGPGADAAFELARHRVLDELAACTHASHR